MDIHLGFLKHPKNAADLLIASQENTVIMTTVYANVLISVLKKFKINKQHDQYTRVVQ